MSGDIGEATRALGRGRARVLTVAQRREAALFLATVARGHPDLEGRDATETQLNETEALAEALEALGFRTKIYAKLDAALVAAAAAARARPRGVAARAAKVTVAEAAADGPAAEFNTSRAEAALAARLPSAQRAPGLGCGADRGTERGYRRHLSAYQVPCSECLAWRVRQLDERWARLGVNPESEVVFPA